MKILSSEQVRAADQYTIENEPIASIDLMERASEVFSKWFIKLFAKDSTISIFCGQGNNGGDGLAVSRILIKKGYKVYTYILKLRDKGSPDFETNLERLREVNKSKISVIESEQDLENINCKSIIIDALFGSGLDRPLEKLPKKLVDKLNSQASIRVSIDIPSGLMADSPSSGTIFQADYTFSFERPKLAFFLAQNYPYVGYWYFNSIGLNSDFLSQQNCEHHYIDYKDAVQLLKTRNKFSHKGNFGHALIVGGSYGKGGAAILASKACMRSGAGLTTAHIPYFAVEAFHSSIPEVMLSIDPNEYLVSKISIPQKTNALAIGPGLGQDKQSEKAIEELLENFNLPSVWDADALNILSKNKDLLKKLPQKTILTPHPKEFERLFGKCTDDWERLELLKSKAQELNLIIVLKGGHTAIAFPDGNVWWNTTGNPGMAKGGSGDVLTGIICGFLAQGYSPESASVLSVYLHGLSADLALKKIHPNFLSASDIIDFLNKSLQKITSGVFEK